MTSTTSNSNHTKGTTVIDTEHSPKAPHSTGIFAALRALLRVKGSGASALAPILATTVATLLTGAGLTAALPATAGAYATIEGPPKFSAAPGLPDGRVYEQVSPADKNGNQAGASSDGITGATEKYGYATADGNSVLFEGTGPMGESAAATNLEFVATHESGGWVTRALEPGQYFHGKLGETLSSKLGYLDPSPDLSHAIVEASDSLEFPPQGCGGDQLMLTGPSPFDAATWLERPEIADPLEDCQNYLQSGAPVGGTPDFSTVYFTYPGTLLPADASRAPHVHPFSERNEAWGFYEDREGELREAGILPADSPYPGEPSPFGAVPAASGHGRNLASRDLSEDGERAFFVSPDPASCTYNGGQNNCSVDPPELYVREHGETTLLLSKDTQLPEVGELPAGAPDGVSGMPNPTENAGPFDGSYVFASPDGSQAFFQSVDRLTSDAPEGPPGNTAPKTYDYDVDTGSLSYLPGVTGELVATDSTGTSLAFERAETAVEPAELDLWTAGPEPEGRAHGTVTPVTKLTGPVEAYKGGHPKGRVTTVRLSSDGSVLVFATSSPLSSAFNSGGHQEVYRYDVATDMLGCVSCAPVGVTPNGQASLSSVQPGEDYELANTTNNEVVENSGISANGDRVFFDTPTPLVPQDANTNAPEVEVSEGEQGPQGRDVYEWENGVVYLISGGKSPRNAYLVGNGENGDDVFFATMESFVPGDTDGAYDVYDARVPHPGDNPPAAAVPCEGAVCQGPPNVPSPLTPPASSTFSGLGNPPPEAPSAAEAKETTPRTVKCAKGKKLSHKKCVTVKRKRQKMKRTSNNRRPKS